MRLCHFQLNMILPFWSHKGNKGVLKVSVSDGTVWSGKLLSAAPFEVLNGSQLEELEEPTWSVRTVIIREFQSVLSAGGAEPYITMRTNCFLFAPVQ